MTDPDSGRAAGIFAYAVSDEELQFHEFLFTFARRLGRAGGRLLHWRPIGDPAQSDSVYREQLTKKQQEVEAGNSAAYRAQVIAAGDTHWYLRQEYDAYASLFGLDVAQAPFVVFGAPQLSRRAVLTIPIEILADQKQRRHLAATLASRLSVGELQAFRRNGYFDNGSLKDIQRKLEQLELEVYRVINPGAKRFPRSEVVRLPADSKDRPIEPGIETILRWRSREDGGLWLKATSRGEVAKTHEFELRNKRITKQQLLLEGLLREYGESVPLGRFLSCAYAEELEEGGTSAEAVASLMPRLRALFSNTADTLEKAEFPKGIIPRLQHDKDEGYRVQLNVAGVNDGNSRPDRRLKYCDDVEDMAVPEADVTDAGGAGLGRPARSLRRPRPD